MGGASTATPVDAIGTVLEPGRDRPARPLGGRGRGGVPVSRTSTSNRGGPFGLRSGRTRSDSGVAPTSNVGSCYQPEDGPLTFGIGLNTLGGGGVNYPGDLSNPILSGIGLLGNVQGPIAASMTLLQLTPVSGVQGHGQARRVRADVRRRMTSFDPAYSVPRTTRTATGSGRSRRQPLPPVLGRRGEGRLRVLGDRRFDVGFGYTSPQWFETWTYHARTELGLPRTLFLNVSLPAIYSLGVGYRPTDRLQLVTDLR